MRILFILTRGDAVGGASIHVRDLARRLMDEGHYAFVLVGRGQEVPEALRAADVPFRQIDALDRALHPRKDLAAFWRIISEVRRWQPDIISCHTAKAGALGRIAARIKRVRSIYSPHCWSFVDDFPRAKLYLWLERLLRPATDQLVAVSEYERQQGIAAGICTNRNSLTIHNGMPDTDETFRAKPDKPTPNLTMIARFDSQKDQQSLLIALTRLKHREWHLHLIGDGPSRPAIEHLADASGLDERITFHGYSDNVAQQLQSSQIFILSTHWESFPRSILEAMRSGLPIVASDVGGCAESVLDGANGLLVPPKNPEALADALSRLLDEPETRLKMGRISRKHYEERFHFDLMFTRYMRLYEEMTSNPTGDDQGHKTISGFNVH